MSDVDMVTITIGGNDAGFAGVLEACVLGAFDCGRGDLPDDYGEIQARLVALFAELKRTVPNASIFVLGYPQPTPEPIEASRTAIDGCGLPGRPLRASFINSGALTAIRHFVVLGNADDTAISFSEAAFLWNVTTELNGAIKSAAEDAGVHFVDVVGGVSTADYPNGFVGHSPCGSPPLLNGFVSETGLRLHGPKPYSDAPFHPNELGQRVYARLLESYIRSQADSGEQLNDGGLAVNPGDGR